MDRKSDNSNKRKNLHSAYFAPQRMQKEMIAEQEVEKYQKDYVEKISQKNKENEYLTNSLYDPEVQKQQKYSNVNAFWAFIRKTLDSWTWSIVNIVKAFLVLGCVGLFMVLIVRPIAINSVPLSLAIDSKKGIANSANISSLGLQEANKTQADINRELSISRANVAVAQNVKLTVYGKTETFNTDETTVGDVLKWKGITLKHDAGVYPTQNAVVGDNQDIIVDTIVSKSTTEEAVVPNNVIRQDDSSILKGDEVVTDAGQEGEKLDTYIVNSVAGHESGRELLSSLVLKAPKDKIIKVGTYVQVAEEVAPSVVVDSPKASAPKSEIKKYAYDQMLAMGYGADQWSCLENIWQRESGWRVKAGNMFSGAYGIPQALPGSKMSAYGSDWETNYEPQIKWGLHYIKGRYGSPCGAWSKWQSRGWY
jgi:hypothetical protein